MPILNRKYNHRKVWRPQGAPYADGASTWPLSPEVMDHSTVAVTWGIETAVNGAIRAFEQEFGRPPRYEIMVIEVATTHRGATARVFEIDPDEDNAKATNPTYAGAATRPSEGTTG